MQVRPTNPYKGRFDLHLPISQFRPWNVVFDVDLFFAIVPGGSHRFRRAISRDLSWDGHDERL